MSRSRKKRTQQYPKNYGSPGFRMFRPLTPESAEEVYDRLTQLRDDGTLPKDAKLRTPDRLHLTLVEKGKMRRNLRNFGIGFDASVEISKINQRSKTFDKPVKIKLGRCKVMGHRNSQVASGTEYNQHIADEYSVIFNAIRECGVPFRDDF